MAGMSGAVVSYNEFIKIRNNVLVGSGVLITDNNAHSINSKLRITFKDSAKYRYN